MKMERFNEILNKLMQMEDAEENLEMVPLYEEALELSKEIYGEYNLKTLEIYNIMVDISAILDCMRRRNRF